GGLLADSPAPDGAGGQEAGASDPVRDCTYLPDGRFKGLRPARRRREVARCRQARPGGSMLKDGRTGVAGAAESALCPLGNPAGGGPNAAGHDGEKIWIVRKSGSSSALSPAYSARPRWWSSPAPAG